ncbi:hypothetical protein E6O75_ATG10693 [Venturia nashicola]|uniref:FAD/NAD(P)-binding domain-containing protein n=1 Tax=Venturia nashicola TaxID=86259 RepID=A0A4Z1NT90_9PEZI|nr:hypothetical protein E6O75_ATG10693 [Venturia nashicola]
MARRYPPKHVETVIIGGGPSALILSYILHGHIPYYSRSHFDPLLDNKLKKERNLLKVTPDAYAHLYSSLRYSTQALPLNTLLDTLIRPNADTEIDPESCVDWLYRPETAIHHAILTDGSDCGGQWVDNPDNPVSTNPDIGTLSYSEMLSLPGYSYAQHYELQNNTPLPELQRPSRAEVADYFAVYPHAVGIQDSLYTGAHVNSLSRTPNGFYIASHGVLCKNVVLATGIFTQAIAPPPLLSPLARLDIPAEPLLIIGSGFSAADVIISAPPTRKIVHIFRWTPDIRPSPLRGCHHAAYPEYAGIYRQMKLASMSSNRPYVASPVLRRKSNPSFSHRDWASVYEGLPNAEVVEVRNEGNSARLRIRLESGNIIERIVGGLEYVVGRRGNLDYLSPPLRREVLGSPERFEHPLEQGSFISGRSLRRKVEIDFEVAPSIFVIGSLTGDSLVRHAFGGSVAAASRIMGTSKNGKIHTRAPAHINSGFEVHASGGAEHTDLHIDRRGIIAR